LTVHHRTHTAYGAYFLPLLTVIVVPDVASCQGDRKEQYRQQNEI